MKNITQFLFRGACLGGALMATTILTAQQNNELQTVKDWLRQQNYQVKVYSQAQYNALDPAERAKLDATNDKIVYNGSDLSLADIRNYETAQQNPTALRSTSEIEATIERAKEEARDQRIQAAQQAELNYLKARDNKEMEYRQVTAWMSQNPHVKLVSMQDFQQATPAYRAEINALPHKIIYADKLTWADIQAYQMSGGN